MRRLGCLFILLVAAAAIFAVFQLGRNWSEAGPLAQPTTITVPEGATLRGMAGRLEKAGAIRSANSFLVFARLLGKPGVIKAGDYKLPAHASGSQILDILQGGKTVALLVTIPEGMPSVMVEERLKANADLSGPSALPAEGSILPDSYGYERGESRANVMARMQAAMDKFLATEWPRRAPGLLVKTPREALTLASIVEKETAVASERPTVAAVYYNRLRAGMRLQADPTIIYPITKGKPLGRRILQSEVRAVNGYNTYAMTDFRKARSPIQAAPRSWPCCIRRRARRSISSRTARAAMSSPTAMPRIRPMWRNGTPSAASAARCSAQASLPAALARLA